MRRAGPLPVRRQTMEEGEINMAGKFDEILRRKISQTLGEPIDESANADDLMFDLGMRYLRKVAAEKRRKDHKKKGHQLSLWVDGSASKKALNRFFVMKPVTLSNRPPVILPR